MAKKLLIVESPTKAKTISKYLDQDFIVVSTSGHIKDLPVSQLGVDVEDNFKPRIVVLNSKRKYLRKIISEAKQANSIYIATDPDREGEAIAQHIKEELPEKKPVKRLLFYEITPQGINSALDNPLDLDYSKIDAQVTRRILDRLVGYEISPLLWTKIKRGLSAGRVQTVALRLIEEREQERKAFKSEEYWTLDFILAKDKLELTARLEKIKGKKANISTEKQAGQIIKDVESHPAVLTEINIKDRRRHSPPPYTTSTLQQDANKILGYSAKKTMTLAQQLFEGVDIEDQTIGLITYMRTDSYRISDQAVEETRQFLVDQGKAELIPPQPKKYSLNNKKIQGAHEAIRPTSVYRTPEQLKSKLPRDQLRLYQMIWNRLISSQCKDSKEKVYTLIFSVLSKYELRTSYTQVTFAGFREIIDPDVIAKTSSKIDYSKFRKGEQYKIKDCQSQQHFTQPPPRYTEASLIKQLDSLGIGRPSTYAPIISIIQDRKYVYKQNKALVITKLGEVVSQYLTRSFPDLFNVNFTAKMENELDEIEQNTKTKNEVLSDFYNPFKHRLEDIRNNPVPIEISEEDKICPLCGSKMEIKKSAHGLFLVCENYPQCPGKKDVLTDHPPPKETDRKCPKCGNALLAVHGRYGRFLKCSNYAKCKTTLPFFMNIDCPQTECDGEIIEKQSSKGKIYWRCNQCDFIIWNKPTNKTCPSCGFKLMVKKTYRRNNYLFCPQCKSKIEDKDDVE
ncbi:MAG: type I DNA topoisomerase [bacterium]